MTFSQVLAFDFTIFLQNCNFWERIYPPHLEFTHHVVVRIELSRIVHYSLAPLPLFPPSLPPCSTSQINSLVFLLGHPKIRVQFLSFLSFFSWGRINVHISWWFIWWVIDYPSKIEIPSFPSFFCRNEKRIVILKRLSMCVYLYIFETSDMKIYLVHFCSD